MSEIKDGGTAFPVNTQRFEDGSINVHPEIGMTLRDYFAAKVVAAIASRPDPSWLEGANIDHMARLSYGIADAMLRARGVA